MFSRSVRRLALIVGLSLGCGSVQNELKAADASSPRVRVQVVSERPATLMTDGFGQQCVSPCKLELSVDQGPYFFQVKGLPDSPRFELPQSSAPLQLTVLPAAPVLPGLAAVVGTMGAAGTAIGLTVLFGDLGGLSNLEGMAVPGALTAGASSFVLSAGLVMWALTGTHVRIERAGVAF